MKKNNLDGESRRKFLATMLPVGTFFCLGCPGMSARNISSPDQLQQKNDHKFQSEFCRSHEEAFRWRFGYFIDQMEILSELLGKDKLIDLLKTAAYQSQLKKVDHITGKPLARFVNDFKNNEFHDKTLTFELIEESDKVFLVKTKECLWAKTFLDRGAGDIGYASICCGEVGYAKAYSPKMNLELVNNLMLGDDHCLKRYSIED